MSDAPARPVPPAAGPAGEPQSFVGRKVRLWRRHDFGMADGFPFETVALDFVDGLLHVRNDDGVDFWTPVLTLGCIEVIDGLAPAPSPPVEFKG